MVREYSLSMPLANGACLPDWHCNEPQRTLSCVHLTWWPLTSRPQLPRIVPCELNWWKQTISDLLDPDPQIAWHWVSDVGHSPLKQKPLPPLHELPFFLNTLPGQWPWLPSQYSGISHSSFASEQMVPACFNLQLTQHGPVEHSASTRSLHVIGSQQGSFVEHSVNDPQSHSSSSSIIPLPQDRKSSSWLGLLKRQIPVPFRRTLL